MSTLFKKKKHVSKGKNFLKLIVYYFGELKRTIPIHFEPIEIILFLPNFYITKPKRNHKQYFEIGFAWIVWRLFYKTKRSISIL